MKWLKRLGASLLVLGVVAVVVFAIGNAAGVPFFRGAIRFPAMMANFTAKTVCSCVFVGGRTDEQCFDFAKQKPEIASSVVDRGAFTVTSTALLVTRSARFTPGQGCSLVD